MTGRSNLIRKKGRAETPAPTLGIYLPVATNFIPIETCFSSPRPFSTQAALNCLGRRSKRFIEVLGLSPAARSHVSAAAAFSSDHRSYFANKLACIELRCQIVGYANDQRCLPVARLPKNNHAGLDPLRQAVRELPQCIRVEIRHPPSQQLDS